MTVQVINDVVALQHSSSSDQWTINKEEEDAYLRFRKKPCEDDDYTISTVSLSSKDSDDDSVISTSSSTVASTNRVSFSDELITMEWTRPYTEPEDVPLLYYSTEETNRYVGIHDDTTVDFFSRFFCHSLCRSQRDNFDCVTFSTISTVLLSRSFLYIFLALILLK